VLQWNDVRKRGISKMQSLLKFITCGSVDDGKSTLIGRLLYDSKLLFTDQLKALELESKVSSRSGGIDYSLLLDGLSAEREQGITIDVAYRFFNTDKRSFIVADTPGHEQYTRNMAVGASFADLAVILVDATQGLLVQTKRHTRICAMMGIKHIVLAVNKMDLVKYNQNRFDEIRYDFERFMLAFKNIQVHIIPVSATEGSNIIEHSNDMPWYQGSTLIQLLETIDVNTESEFSSFVLPVQRVSRGSQQFRGYQGQIESGVCHVGDSITVLPSLEVANIKSIHDTGKLADYAKEGRAVSIELDRQVDVSRGDVLVKHNNLIVSDMINATLLWMDDSTLIQGRSYWLKCGTKTSIATIMEIKHTIDINTGSFLPSESITKNELANVDLSLSTKMVFSNFDDLKALGGFILIDRVSHMTAACGVIHHDLRRAKNLVYQATDITPQFRAKLKNQKPFTLWFTGLSGSGKTTLANAIESKLAAQGKHTMLLDGDNIRFGLNKNLGFKVEDRVENIRRVAEVSKLMNDAGLIVMASFISPYQQDRELARSIIGESFIEIYVSTPLEVCEQRDVKGLYQKARKGEIPNFTGISDPYEVPTLADYVVDTSEVSIEEAVEGLLKFIEDVA